jgi:hypothetical protein
MTDALLLTGCLLLTLGALVAEGKGDQPAPPRTLYVSKLGDNSDGSSW